MMSAHGTNCKRTNTTKAIETAATQKYKIAPSQRMTHDTAFPTATTTSYQEDADAQYNDNERDDICCDIAVSSNSHVESWSA